MKWEWTKQKKCLNTSEEANQISLNSAQVSFWIHGRSFSFERKSKAFSQTEENQSEATPSSEGHSVQTWRRSGWWSFLQPEAASSVSPCSWAPSWFGSASVCEEDYIKQHKTLSRRLSASFVWPFSWLQPSPGPKPRPLCVAALWVHGFYTNTSVPVRHTDRLSTEFIQVILTFYDFMIWKIIFFVSSHWDSFCCCVELCPRLTVGQRSGSNVAARSSGPGTIEPLIRRVKSQAAGLKKRDEERRAHEHISQSELLLNSMGPLWPLVVTTWNCRHVPVSRSLEWK